MSQSSAEAAGKFLENVNKKKLAYQKAKAHMDAFEKAVAEIQAQKAMQKATFTPAIPYSQPSNSTYADAIARLVPDIMYTDAECPSTDPSTDGLCKYGNTIWCLVQHLNDHHRWTREQIADWLDILHDSGVINLVLTNPNEDRG
jgi:hypothetical protein